MSKVPVAIITGAGSGIGRATAVELAMAGWRCALVGRRSAALDGTATLVLRSAPGAETLCLAADISEAAAAQGIVDQTVAQWPGRIDALINNAAVAIVAPIHQVGDAMLHEMFEVNVMAPVRLVRCVWPHMTRHGLGRVINVSSLSSQDPFPGLGAYGMSKSALEGLTRAVNNEGRSSGIIAFLLVLGAVETEMLRRVVSESVLPRDRTMDPRAVAQVIAACAKGERDAEARNPIVMA